MGRGLMPSPYTGKKMTYHFKPKANKKSSTKKEKGEMFSMVFLVWWDEIRKRDCPPACHREAARPADVGTAFFCLSSH